MNLLAFDTSTDTMFIAVSRTGVQDVQGGQGVQAVQLWQHTAPGGAQTSTSLIPAILALLADAGLRLSELDAICFGSGPGSFTGLRTACSVAQGLALGANLPVLAVDSLLAVAEDARHAALANQPHGIVTALLDARMDELYAASYAFEDGRWTEREPSALVRPEDLTPWAGNATAGAGAGAAMGGPWAGDATAGAGTAKGGLWVMAGNVFAVYGERVGASSPAAAAAKRVAALPTATAMLRLAPAMLAQGLAVSAEHAMPRYVRDKVAKTTAERAAEKAAAASGAAL